MGQHDVAASKPWMGFVCDGGKESLRFRLVGCDKDEEEEGGIQLLSAFPSGCIMYCFFFITQPSVRTSGVRLGLFFSLDKNESSMGIIRILMLRFEFAFRKT